MATPDIQNLEYGIIYVIGNPKQTHNLKWFATMIAPMIRPLSLKWVETWDYEQTAIVARRFNVGNIGKYATVQLYLNKYGHSDSFSLLAAVHAFSDCLEDVMDDSVGDVIIREADYSDRNQPPQGKWGASTASEPMGRVLREYGFDDMQESLEWEQERQRKIQQDHTRVASSAHPLPHKAEQMTSKSCESDDVDELQGGKKSVKNRIKALRKKFKKSRLDEDQALILRDAETIDESVIDYDDDMASASSSANGMWSGEDQTLIIGGDEQYDIEVEEIVEFKRIESEYERDVKDLRARIVAFIAKYHQDPRQVMTTMLEGKVLLGATPGHVLVNGDMKIVLPEYDEMEIKMPAMCRTLYILFMKRRIQGGGIVLRNIDDYRDDIIDIYSLVKPGANEQRVEQTVNNLCDPFSESLNQMISRINRCVKNVITDKELADRYIISGSRGEEYSIGLDPELMTLPRAVTGA